MKLDNIIIGRTSPTNQTHLFKRSVGRLNTYLVPMCSTDRVYEPTALEPTQPPLLETDQHPTTLVTCKLCQRQLAIIDRAEQVEEAARALFREGRTTTTNVLQRGTWTKLEPVITSRAVFEHLHAAGSSVTLSQVRDVLAYRSTRPPWLEECRGAHGRLYYHPITTPPAPAGRS